MRPWNRILVCGWVLTLATAWAQVPPEIKDAPTAAAFPGADGVVLLEKHEIVLDAEGKASWTQRPPHPDLPGSRHRGAGGSAHHL